MADQGVGDRTEQATPERLRKAREEGNVPTSEEVPSALVLLILLVALVMGIGSLMNYFASEVRQGLTLNYKGAMDSGPFGSLLKAKAMDCLIVSAPYMVAVVAASLLGSFIAGGGLTFSPKALKIDWDRVNPAKGVKNLISLKSLVHLAVSTGKCVVIGAIVWQYLHDKLDDLIALNYTTPEGTLARMGALTLGAAGRIAVSLMVISGLDLLYQRWQYRREMRMTKQEVKQERRDYEVPAEVKGKIRSLQTAKARRRAIQAVPTADVVVTNPTHFAVALKYEPGQMDAPVVVAKGADRMAKTLKDLAAKHQVPIVEKPELARALYAAVDEGQAVPEALFVAVAEVLAMIFKLRKKRRV